MKKIITAAILLIFVPAAGYCRDLAGITWEEFKNRSELIYLGTLIKAEVLEDNQGRYTYNISNIYKGPNLKQVTFKAPMRENITKVIGSISFVALKREGKEWMLSVDERSCWEHYNEMKTDFGGLPAVKIPAGLIYNFPDELSSTVTLKRLCPVDNKYHEVEVKVFELHTLEKELKKYINGNE